MKTAYSYIRFSTPEQAQGRSEARQSERAQQFCKQHELKLDNAVCIDRGVSAYHGKNARVGALGQFISAVESGRIKPGSVLLIENLDRLSRDDIELAQDLFKKIIKLGIDIVTLSDQKVYTQESLKDPFAIIQAILYMSRAHEESQMKSKRAKDVWNNKRLRVMKTGDIYTHKIPAWLQYDGDRKKFITITERVRIIKQIFDMAKDGCGKIAIMKTLNRARVPSWHGKAWSATSIKNILRDEKLIGKYQLYTTVHDKRVPEGEPVQNYFPKVIDDKLFYLIQRKRKAPLKGPAGGKISNLFTGLIRCGYCGSVMHFINKGDENQYLVCSKAKCGAGCTYVSVRYLEIEKLYLDGCSKNFDLSDVFKSNKHSKVIDNLRNQITGGEAQIAENRKRLERLMMSFADSDNIEVQNNYNNLIKKLSGEIESLKKEIEQTKSKLHDLESAAGSMLEKFKTTTEYMDRLKTDMTARATVRNIFRDVAQRFDVWPLGEKEENILKFYRDGKPVSPQNKERLKNDRKFRCYSILFKDGTVKLLYPMVFFDRIMCEVPENVPRNAKK